MKIFLLFFLCCMLVFAIHKEYRDQPNCYLEAIPVKTDSKAVLLKKITNKNLASTRAIMRACAFSEAMHLKSLLLPYQNPIQLSIQNTNKKRPSKL